MKSKLDLQKSKLLTFLLTNFNQIQTMQLKSEKLFLPKKNTIISFGTFYGPFLPLLISFA